MQRVHLQYLQWLVLDCDIEQYDVPSSRTNHCQACRPAIPSIFVRIPAARSPEKIFEMMLPACHMLMRRGDSCFVYHEEVIRETAGRKGPSVIPTRKRQRRKDHPDFIAGMQIVTADQASMQQGNRMRGFLFAMITFAGIWEIM